MNATVFDDLYGTRYFSASDLHGKTRRLKIGKVLPVELRDKDGSTKKKLALWFEGEAKSLPLNMTNAQRLAQAFGKDCTNWLGATLELYSETTPYGEGVRLRPQKSVDASPDDDLVF